MNYICIQMEEAGMKKIVDDERLIYKVCCLYYQDDLNQKEIGDYLGISRSSVLRMLQKGREIGIVTIELNNPVTYNYGEQEKKLETLYGLRDAVIVEDSVLDTMNETSSHLFGQAAQYLYDTFHEGDQIGVTMGSTLNNVVATNKTFEKYRNLMFVPMIGGVSKSTIGKIDLQGNELARKFADKFGGTYTQFLSPAVFTDKKILTYFMQEKAVNYIFDEFKKINVAVLALGTTEREDHTLLQAGYLTPREMQMLKDGGAVGDIAFQFYDQDGNTDAFRFFNDRVAAMPLSRIREIPIRIGIANGEQKARSVIAAIRGGFINVLITNEDCAKYLIESKD